MGTVAYFIFTLLVKEIGSFIDLKILLVVVIPTFVSYRTETP